MNEHIEKLIEIEQLVKSNTRRIGDLENEAKSNNKLVTSVEKLTLEIKYMREDYQKLSKLHTEEVRAIDSRLKEVESKPAKRWEEMISLVIATVVGTILGYVLNIVL